MHPAILAQILRLLIYQLHSRPLLILLIKQYVFRNSREYSDGGTSRDLYFVINFGRISLSTDRPKLSFVLRLVTIAAVIIR